MKRWYLSAVLLVLALPGCSKEVPKILGAPIEGINHTSAAINHFQVNGNGGSNLGPHGGGGQTCCVALPTQWHPGLTVVVEWEKDPNVRASRHWPEPMFSDAWRARMKEHRSKYTRHRAIVEVAPYEELGVVDVHFMPCDQVLVSAVAQLPGKPGYPYNYPRKMEVPKTCPAP
ncbi:MULTISPECIES: DUF3304 domain-containing protein [unclassified Pseudomonas]|uniref:DUF3304 domain-containing protein n=1 Tax=unclassified Pseudomonas TaxID=196821 RepID=UPI000C2F9A92|nr:MULTISPECIES: DUF3304 domain-containing protein [unclassified Pseudomonas]MCU1738500.1 DUF3304 domain-containing protein [Pseudomonas sp. 20S_6.2_Bac1]